MMNLNFKDKLNALNAFLTPSPFQDVVDQATSEYLLTPDWEKNIRIIDQMNHKTDNIKVCHCMTRHLLSFFPITWWLSWRCKPNRYPTFNSHMKFSDSHMQFHMFSPPKPKSHRSEWIVEQPVTNSFAPFMKMNPQSVKPVKTPPLLLTPLHYEPPTPWRMRASSREYFYRDNAAKKLTFRIFFFGTKWHKNWFFWKFFVKNHIIVIFLGGQILSDFDQRLTNPSPHSAPSPLRLTKQSTSCWPEG